MLSMGGYGIYLWPAYGITLVVFSLNFISAILEKRRVKNIIKNYLLEKNEP